MPGIKFNRLTREIELKGSESFIKANFDKIRDLLVESIGEEKMVSREAKTSQEPIAVGKMEEFQAGLELKAKRPPVRKYIRREGMPGQQRVVVEVVEQKPKEVSLESLKEKFGLSKSKIGGIIRDAEKLGKIKRVTNGSYSWT